MLHSSLPTGHCSLPTLHHSLFTALCLLLTVHCPLFTTHCSLLTVPYSPFTVHTILCAQSAEGVKEEIRMAVKALHQASRCLGELAALVPSGVQLRGFGPDKSADDLQKGVAGYDYEPEDIPANLLSQVRTLPHCLA